ncbi:regulatory protein RecX [Butyrivibrio sp. INlla21]|uniref:regulatory protein RecX n=1 Tax=Butyrivibrio sp. INlla21 TaxID=1520811 RepID=UPI0008F36327|nr:regulatory protein RecX [Butyrivibrio sp. INlla21]SFU47658.1 regulatory protein [Butyrivibrio sp. INlla21]
MIISSIVEFDKKRNKIFIDGEFAFVLYKGELRSFGIKEGEEISEETYNEITGSLLPKRATKRAMELLVKKDYTEKKLRDKLADGLYSDDIIDAAIEYVKSYKYLDDERYARDYVAYNIELRSRNRIKQDLISRGVAKDIIQTVLEEFTDEEGREAELDQIKKLLVKKHYDPSMDYKDKQKIIAFLLRKGYPMDAIRSVINSDDIYFE